MQSPHVRIRTYFSVSPSRTTSRLFESNSPMVWQDWSLSALQWMMWNLSSNWLWFWSLNSGWKCSNFYDLHHNMQGMKTKALFSADYIKKDNLCDPKWAKTRLASLGEGNFQNSEKGQYDFLKYIYLETVRMPTKQLWIFVSLQLQSSTQLQHHYSHKLHQRQPKMEKATPWLPPYVTILCCAPTWTCFKFPCQFAIPGSTRHGEWVTIENTTGTGLSRDSVVCWRYLYPPSPQKSSAVSKQFLHSLTFQCLFS